IKVQHKGLANSSRQGLCRTVWWAGVFHAADHIEFHDRVRIACITADKRSDLITTRQSKQDRLRQIVCVDGVGESLGSEVFRDNNRKHSVVTTGIEMRRLVVRTAGFYL